MQKMRKPRIDYEELHGGWGWTIRQHAKDKDEPQGRHARGGGWITRDYIKDIDKDEEEPQVIMHRRGYEVETTKDHGGG